MTDNICVIKKAVIITGTSSGLGLALCDIMLASDYTVISISRRFLPEQVSKAQSNKNFILLECDLAKLEQVNNCLGMLKKTLVSCPEVVFISNAAVIEGLGRIESLDNKAIEEAVTINLTSPMIISKMLMGLPNSQVKVINISTGAAEKPILGWPVYCASKAGAKMFFDIMEGEAESGSFSVTSIDPGAMDTGMQESIRKLDHTSCPSVEYFNSLHASRRLSSSYDAAKLIVERCCL